MNVLVFVIPLLVAGLLVAGRETLRPGHPRDLRRLGPVLLGVAAVGVFALFLGVGSDGSNAPFLLLAAVPLAGVALLRARRGPVAVAERSWSTPIAAQPRAGGPGRPERPPARSVARALGQVEARELATSPWFGVGIGFCVLLFMLFGFVYAGDNNESWPEYVQLAPWLAHPLAGMAVLAGHRAVTRAARDGADELFESCPTEPMTRTAGFLIAAAVPVAALTVFLAALGVANAANSPHVYGPLGADSAADALAAVVLGAGGVVLGVALGRWVRFTLAPVVAVVGIGFATITINGLGDGEWNPLVPLATAPAVEGLSPIFQDRPTWWHLLWVTGLVVVVGVVAVARHRRDRVVAVAAVAAAVIVLAAGIGATRPISSGSAARIVDLIAGPEAHQECATTGGPVEVCVYGFGRELLDRVADRVRPIAAVLPPDQPTLILRQVYDADLDDLPPEVRLLLSEDDLIRPSDEVPLSFGEGIGNVLDDPGFRIAFVALGLPVESDPEGLATVIAGEARGVVALWVATRGQNADDAAVASTPADPAAADAFERGLLVMDDCTVPSVAWSAQDLAAARAVLALPETNVARVVTAGWERWSDPGTGTDELLAALGLPAVGPFDDVEARPGLGC